MAEKIKSVACASCPFRERNFEEFGEVARALSKKCGQPEPDFFQILTIRQRVIDDAIREGRLQCHSSVYDRDMNAHLTGSVPCVGLEQLKKKRPKK